MITVPRWFQAAGAVIILASRSVAGDTPWGAVTLDRSPASPQREDSSDRDWGGLNTRQPYQPGKVPVVLIHGLWGSSRLEPDDCEARGRSRPPEPVPILDVPLCER